MDDSNFMTIPCISGPLTAKSSRMVDQGLLAFLVPFGILCGLAG